MFCKIRSAEVEVHKVWAPKKGIAMICVPGLAPSRFTEGEMSWCNSSQMSYGLSREWLCAWSLCSSDIYNQLALPVYGSRDVWQRKDKVKGNQAHPKCLHYVLLHNYIELFCINFSQNVSFTWKMWTNVLLNMEWELLIFAFNSCYSRSILENTFSLLLPYKWLSPAQPAMGLCERARCPLLSSNVQAASRKKSLSLYWTHTSCLHRTFSLSHNWGIRKVILSEPVFLPGIW